MISSLKCENRNSQSKPLENSWDDIDQTKIECICLMINFCLSSISTFPLIISSY